MRSIWHALAAIFTIGPIAWLISVYPQLPERVPVHWNIHGVADRWSQKGVVSVFLVAAISVEVQLLLGLLIYDAEKAREQSTSATLRHSLSVMVQMLQPMRLATVALFFIIIMGLWQGTQGPTPWFSPAMVACTAFLLVSGFVGAYRAWKAQMEYEAAAPPSSPEFQDENYRWGVFYYNANDENFLVHKRIGIGFTINAAHRRALLYLVVTLALLFTAVGGSLFAY